jgi:hypothetical protein
MVVLLRGFFVSGRQDEEISKLFTLIACSSVEATRAVVIAG